MSSSKIQKQIAFTQNTSKKCSIHSGQESQGLHNDLGTLMGRLNIDQMDDDDFFQHFHQIYQCQFGEDQANSVLNPQTPHTALEQMNNSYCQNSNQGQKDSHKVAFLFSEQARCENSIISRTLMNGSGSILTPCKFESEEEYEKMGWAPQKPINVSPLFSSSSPSKQ